MHNKKEIAATATATEETALGTWIICRTNATYKVLATT